MCDPVTGFELLCGIIGGIGLTTGMDLANRRREDNEFTQWLYDMAQRHEIGDGFDGQAMKLTSAFNHVMNCLKENLPQHENDPLYGKFKEFQPNHKGWAKDPLNKMSVAHVTEVLDMYERFLNPVKDGIVKALEQSVECLGHWHELLEALAATRDFVWKRAKEFKFEWEKAKMIYNIGGHDFK